MSLCKTWLHKKPEQERKLFNFFKIYVFPLLVTRFAHADFCSFICRILVGRKSLGRDSVRCFFPVPKKGAQLVDGPNDDEGPDKIAHNCTAKVSGII